MISPVIERQLELRELASGIQRSFRDAPIYRIRFPRGTMLFKLTGNRAVGQDGRVVPRETGLVSPWWFNYETVRAAFTGQQYVLPGIADYCERANRLPVDIVLFLRSRGAVSLDWNCMTHLLVVELTRETVGAAGDCSGQQIVDDPKLRPAHLYNVRFIGGAKQLYLPGLQPSDLNVATYGPI